MKKISFLFVLAIVLFSCSVHTELEPFSDSDIEGKWQLERIMASMIANAEAEEPTYEEYYILKSNGEFIKSRTVDDTKSEASGTYTISEEEPFQDKEPRKIILLTYDSENDIIENCGTTATEYLILDSNNILFNSWIACDGPILEYEKVK